VGLLSYYLVKMGTENFAKQNLVDKIDFGTFVTRPHIHANHNPSVSCK